MIQKLMLLLLAVLLGTNLYAWTELTNRNEKVIVEINEKLEQCLIQSK